MSQLSFLTVFWKKTKSHIHVNLLNFNLRFWMCVNCLEEDIMVQIFSKYPLSHFCNMLWLYLNIHMEWTRQNTFVFHAIAKASTLSHRRWLYQIAPKGKKH